MWISHSELNFIVCHFTSKIIAILQVKLFPIVTCLHPGLKSMSAAHHWKLCIGLQWGHNDIKIYIYGIYYNS